MTRGLFVAALLLGPAASRADCQVDGIQFFPAPGSVIPTNTHFILEGVGPDQQRVLSLVGDMVTFKTTDDIILGKVRQGWRSEMNRAAVVIVPNHTFLHNRKYTLELGGALAHAKVLNETGEMRAWDVGATADERPPKWLRKPAVSEGQYTYEAGKLSRYVNLNMEMEELSPAYLVVTMRRSHSSTASQTYFVPVRDGKALLGHDSCSGSFVFEDGKSYKADILGYDIAGNLAATTPQVEFQSPKALPHP